MPTTTNLGLTLLEGQSLVDYNDINNYVKAIDSLGVDYVSRKGVDGNWWFRVWKSGRCECGVDNKAVYESVNLNTEWGGNKTTGLWVPSSRLQPWNSFPVNFVSRPYVNVCFNYCTENASCIVIQSSVSLTNPPQFVIANSGRTILNDVQLSVNCTGNAKG